MSVNQRDVIKRLKQFVDQFETQKEAAKSLRIRPAYLSDLLNGRRDPGPTVLKALGLRKSYEVIQ